ncbi:MAG TPA: oligosaccharide flippase family protein [Vicinamibacterales bacterium]|nr:oligosaccharide flippase family protein [Vicinamibacterales bacterium]
MRVDALDGVDVQKPERPALLVIAGVTGAFAASNVMRGGIRLATSLIVARGLGGAGFGRWVFCAAWAGTLTSVLDLGFGALLTRDAARNRNVSGLVSRAFIARAAAFVPVAAVFLIAAPLVRGAADVDALRAAVPLAGTSIAYGCIAAVFRGWPDRLLWILGLETAGALVQAGLSWLLIRHGAGVAALLWLAAAVQAAQLAAAMAVLMAVRGAEDRFEWPRVTLVAGAVRRSMPFALTGLVASAQNRIAPLLLGYMSGAAEVASFGAAWRLGNAARAVPSAAFAGALPVLTARAGRADASARSSFHRALRLFTIAASATLALLSPIIVRWTYGSGFSGAVIPLVCVAAGLVPSLLNASRRVYLYAERREAVALRWSAAALAIQIAACALLIPRWGAEGAAIGLLAGEAAVWWPLSRA